MKLLLSIIAYIVVISDLASAYDYVKCEHFGEGVITKVYDYGSITIPAGKPSIRVKLNEDFCSHKAGTEIDLVRPGINAEFDERDYRPFKDPIGIQYHMYCFPNKGKKECAPEDKWSLHPSRKEIEERKKHDRFLYGSSEAP